MPRARKPQSPKPGAAPEPQYRTVASDGTASRKGRYAGHTLDQVIQAAKGDSVSRGDVSVFLGSELVAVVQYRPDEGAPLFRVIDPKDALPKPYKPPRYCDQTPMMRQTITFSPPWDRHAVMTMEIILLPSGGSGGCPDVDDRVPETKEDLYVLHEAGWEEYQDSCVTAFVRFVR